MKVFKSKIMTGLAFKHSLHQQI